jgi:CheY-like chemotaxis protein
VKLKVIAKGWHNCIFASIGFHMKNVILLVDDDHDLVDSLSALFLQHGWIPQRAYSGGEALAYAGRSIPSVVVCDIAMPGVSGYEVAEAMKSQLAADCPILIALTGWSDASVTKQALNAGFSVVLTKPIEFEHLISAVKLGFQKSN